MAAEWEGADVNLAPAGGDLFMHRTVDSRRTICGQVIPERAVVRAPAERPPGEWCPGCWVRPSLAKRLLRRLS
jgi:hypothetical protein